MTNKIVDAGAEQGQLKELLPPAAAGADVVLIADGTPVTRPAPVSPRIAGLHRGSVTTYADFDAPLLIE